MVLSQVLTLIDKDIVNLVWAITSYNGADRCYEIIKKDQNWKSLWINFDIYVFETSLTAGNLHYCMPLIYGN